MFVPQSLIDKQSRSLTPGKFPWHKDKIVLPDEKLMIRSDDFVQIDDDVCKM